MTAARVKKHVTVTLTREYIAPLVCGAIEHYDHLLPAKISTDPVKNIELALELAEHPRAGRRADVEFLAWRVIGMISGVHDDADNVPDADYITTEYRPEATDRFERASIDAWVVAQWLSWIADKIATEEGR